MPLFTPAPALVPLAHCLPQCVCLWRPRQPPVHTHLFLAVPVAGTLTQNEMVFKRLHLGTVSYGPDTIDEIERHVRDACPQVSRSHPGTCTLSGRPAPRDRRPCDCRPLVFSELLARIGP